MKNTVLILTLLVSQLSWSAQILVDSSEFNATNNGNCNFAEAVLSAGFDLAFDQCVQGNGDDVIVFDPLLFPLPLNTLFLTVDDTLVVFGDSLDIQVPVGKTLSLNSNVNQPIFTVDLNPNSAFSLNQTILKNASSTNNGGAIQFDEDIDDITLTRVAFENNDSSGNGGAIGFQRTPGSTNVTTLNLIECTFMANSAASGGAIYADRFVKLNISDGAFINNTAAEFGGAIRIVDDVDINFTVFNGNQAQFGGGVFSVGGNTGIENSVFENNSAMSKGGGLFKSNLPTVTTSELEFRRNSVLNNSASTGAGLFVEYSQLSFINNLLANNTASDGVGGLHNNLVDAADRIHEVRIIGNSFYHNIAQGGGSAVADIQSHFSDNMTIYKGNAMASQVVNNAQSKCRFLRINGVLSKHNLSSDDMNCLVGNDNQILADPVANYAAQSGFHPFKLIPQVTSPLIDAWARNDCNDEFNLLDFDLTGRRNHSGLFNIYDGDANDQGHCDIGSAEIPDAVLVKVGQIGAGSGRIYGNPETAIDCPGPGICAQAIVIGESVTFTTEAYTGSEFVSWGLDGSACGTSPNCQLTVPDHTITISAEFELVPSFLLAVTKDGNSNGLIYTTSLPRYIDCGMSCFAQVAENGMVTLEATPATGSIFMGWSGDCSGTGSCQLLMDQDKNVNATFNLAHELNVDSGPGGSVNSADGGIDCPSDCHERYEVGATVTLMPTPDAGYVFAGWSGDCSGTGSCQLLMDQDKNVNATFNLAHELNVNSGPGGSVSSADGGIDCPSDCHEFYEAGTTVTLMSTPDAGYVFAGWSGVCNGLGSCVFTISSDGQVSASFVSDDVIFANNFEPL